jgi:hypothetical protein
MEPTWMAGLGSEDVCWTKAAEVAAMEASNCRFSARSTKIGERASYVRSTVVQHRLYRFLLRTNLKRPGTERCSSWRVARCGWSGFYCALGDDEHLGDVGASLYSHDQFEILCRTGKQGKIRSAILLSTHNTDERLFLCVRAKMTFKMICLHKLSLANGTLLFGGCGVPCDMGIRGRHDARFNKLRCEVKGA